MIFNLKVISLPLLVLGCYCYGQCASDENLLKVHSIITLPYELNLQRVKRQGGGGVIPFRPLFVYRQQQREQQARWKEIEARKKLQQEQLEYQQYQKYQETIKQHQQSYESPTTAYISSYDNTKYRPPATQYSSYNYPTKQSSSYRYPSYYFDQNEYPKYYNSEPFSNYYDYYDGYGSYEYS